MRGVMHIDLENEYGHKTDVCVTVEYEHYLTPIVGQQYELKDHWIESPIGLTFDEETKALHDADTIFWQRVGLGQIKP